MQYLVPSLCSLMHKYLREQKQIEIQEFFPPTAKHYEGYLGGTKAKRFGETLGYSNSNASLLGLLEAAAR